MNSGMAINQWWSTDPGQRYWMEITDRADLGADLLAPTSKEGGLPYWGYELLTHVGAGDIVFHWHKTLAGAPAIVGWSVASGEYENTTLSWKARGTVGQTKGSWRPRPGWRMPLEGYTPLPAPLTLAQVQGHEAALRQTEANLTARLGQQSLYFPWYFSDSRALRAQQSYLVKMPREAVDLLGLPAGPPAPPAGASGHTRESHQRRSSRGGSGYLTDAAVRSAIEWRAVNLATALYRSEGMTVEYTGANKPYDLEVSAPDHTTTRRVEVKGSSGQAEEIQLTAGEVRNSRLDQQPTDLVVVEEIEWQRHPDGTVTADGGNLRRWSDWTAEEIQPHRNQLPIPAATQKSVPAQRTRADENPTVRPTHNPTDPRNGGTRS